MASLYFAITVMVVIAIVLFLLTAQWVRRMNAWQTAIIGAGAVALLFLHALVLMDSLTLARWLPLRDVIVWGNITPLAVAILAAVVWAKGPRPRWRRALLIIVLAGLGVQRAYGALLGPIPRLGDNRWNGDVCRQTSSASCSPAAAATLLCSYGISTSEREMAELCLTRENGTSMLGLYRGMSIKAAAAGYRVRVFRGSFDQFRQSGIGPALLSVGLRRGATADPRYQRDWGWAPGVRHTVVFYAYAPGGKADMGDPSVGREQWFAQDIQMLWFGEALYLEKAAGNGP